MKKTFNRIAIATFLAALAIAPSTLLSSKHPATADGMPGKKTPVVVADGMPGKKTPVVVADGMPGSKTPRSVPSVNV